MSRGKRKRVSALALMPMDMAGGALGVKNCSCTLIDVGYVLFALLNSTYMDANATRIGTTMLMGLLSAGPWGPLAVYLDRLQAWADIFLLAFRIILIMNYQCFLLFLHLVALQHPVLEITTHYSPCGPCLRLFVGILDRPRNLPD